MGAHSRALLFVPITTRAEEAEEALLGMLVMGARAVHMPAAAIVVAGAAAVAAQAAVPVV